MFSPSSSALLLLCAAVLAQQPEQFHISLTGQPGEMAIEFVTHGPNPGPNTCFYGKDPSLAPPSTPLPPSPILPSYLYGAGYLVAGDDLFSSRMSVQAAGAWCSANATCAGFTFASTDPGCGNCSILFKSRAEFSEGAGWQTYEKPAPPAANATSTFFTYATVGNLHTAVLRGLQPATRYYYLCGNYSGGWGPLFSFVSEPTTWRAAIFADFGRDNDESLLSLYSAAEAGDFDLVIHAGDFAYDLDSENGEVGNQFFRNQEGYAARYPLLPAPGNHESHQNYSQYTARFSGVASNLGVNSGSGSAHYYSLDVGLVHLVAFSTEVYWSMQGAVQSQLNWLKQDLAKANANRAKVPWIVAFGHKSWYMDTTYCVDSQCYANGTWFDMLLHEGGADLYFVGHMHEYRRMVPAYGTQNLTDLNSISGDSDRAQTYTDPKYLTTIVTGAAGNQEVQPSDCGGPTPHFVPQPTATCSRNYGWGTLEISNSTHATWRWTTSMPISGSPAPDYTDTLELIVNSHGPRPPPAKSAKMRA